MFNKSCKTVAISLVLAGLGLQPLWARDLKITIPRHTEATPVQRLNRDGVDAVRKHQYEKAEALFWKAYLYDPSDPFTLNNLGYISELQGELERALKFYELAAKQGSTASIDRSSAKQLEGKPMEYALSGLKDAPMRVDHLNVQAVGLLSENRGSEANALLEQALAIEPHNTFTLNNLGVVRESLGDYDAALRYYNAAAAERSSDPVVVTLDRAWRGKPISDMAANSAEKLKKLMKNTDSAQAQAALFAVRGVSATNRNDWQTAKQDFLKAYSLDPNSAFSLNNLGYVSEREGDIETAHFFYTKAQMADNAGARVGLASESSAEGKHVVVVASDSDEKVNGEIGQYQQARHAETGDIELIHRGNSTEDNATPEPQQPASPQTPSATPKTPPPAAPTHPN